MDDVQGLIVNDSGLGGTLARQWRKAIPEARDRLQSRVLVWVVGLTLAVPCLLLLIRLIVLVTGISAPRRYHAYPHEIWYAAMPWVVSLTFAAVVWVLRAATPMAAICGGMVCLIITFESQSLSMNPLASGLAPLLVLFVLTFVATKLGKAWKTDTGPDEEKRGRCAAQVLANLGSAALVVVLCAGGSLDWMSPVGGIFGFSHFAALALLTAALCEATADTVSSEIGAAFGGRPILITTLQRVEPGTDGAVSLLGTAAGVIAAIIVAVVSMWAMQMSAMQAGIGLAGGIAGLLWDSFLGATLERKGWLGNDLVNFFSTLFAIFISFNLLFWL